MPLLRRVPREAVITFYHHNFRDFIDLIDKGKAY